MAGKGTFVAYTPLKPTELKVGDYFNSFVDDLIKRNDANELAKAKALADQKTAIGAKFDSFKFNPTATIPQFSDVSRSLFLDVVDRVGTERLNALKDPANAPIYLSKAEKLYNQYEAFRVSFSSKDFMDAAKAKQDAIAKKEVFISSDNNEQLKMLGYKVPSYELKDDGALVFKLPKNANATKDDPLEEKTPAEVLALWTSQDEVNLLRSNSKNENNGFLDKQVFTIAKEMQDEYKNNFDGNITNARKWFNEKRGGVWFDGRFGSEFNGMSIDPLLNQYSKEVLKKEIKTPEDYANVKKAIVDFVGSHVGESKERDTEKTAQEMANDALKGKVLKRQANAPYSSGSSNQNDGVGVMSIGVIQKADGQNTVEAHNTVTLDLGKGKSVVGFLQKNSKPNPKTGKYDNHIEYSYVGRDKNDRQTYERIATTQDVMASIVGAGINPTNFINTIKEQGVVQFKNRKTKNDVGVIKYKTAYKPSEDKNEDETTQQQALIDAINNSK